MIFFIYILYSYYPFHFYTFAPRLESIFYILYNLLYLGNRPPAYTYTYIPTRLILDAFKTSSVNISPKHFRKRSLNISNPNFRFSTRYSMFLCIFYFCVIITLQRTIFSLPSKYILYIYSKINSSSQFTFPYYIKKNKNSIVK